MRRAAKVDLNHTQIVEGLRKLGYRVQSLAAIGRGCPDLLVGMPGRLVLLEVKSDKGSLTPDQVGWMNEWVGCPVYVVRSLAEALSCLRASDG